jgi:hypothetical protein
VMIYAYGGTEGDSEATEEEKKEMEELDKK